MLRIPISAGTSKFPLIRPSISSPAKRRRPTSRCRLTALLRRRTQQPTTPSTNADAPARQDEDNRHNTCPPFTASKPTAVPPKMTTGQALRTSPHLASPDHPRPTSLARNPSFPNARTPTNHPPPPQSNAHMTNNPARCTSYAHPPSTLPPSTTPSPRHP